MKASDKKYGGIIEQWQLHTLSTAMDTARDIYPELTSEKVQILTGIIKEDPTGRWEEGWHMRSSAIVKFDEEALTVETLNTIYQLEGESGDPYFADGDAGDFVIQIIY